jgi:hypothetical protein
VNIFLQIILLLCAVALLLPGLCTVYFGAMFVASGGWVFAVIWLVVGGLLCWGALAIYASVFRD